MPQPSDPMIHRLIERGHEVLEPADRALLNLWLGHGLSDERLSALTRISVSDLEARRARIVAHLSRHLALPPHDVLAALTQAKPRTDAPVVARTQPGADAVAPTPVRRSDRTGGAKRGRWAGPLATAGAIGVGIAGIVVLSGGSPPLLDRNTATAGDDALTQAPGGHVSRSTRPLLRLPAQLARASGSARLAGAGPDRRIELSARGLTALHSGQYEVWLSNSAQAMQRLGRLRAGAGSTLYRVPADARRFRWIDVTLRHPGADGDAGDLVLRARNPALAPSASSSERAQLADPSPSWSDEFTGTSLDTGDWSINTGGGGHGNGDLEDYTASNVSVAGGDLSLTAKESGSTITSGSIQSLGKVSAQYGLIEASIEVPKGDGLWPAFWMQGTDAATVGWPADGEIDVMEILGNDEAANNGSLHTSSSSATQFAQTNVEPCSCDLSAGFHTYAIDWSPGQVQFMLDGTVYATETKAQVQAAGGTWTFDAPFFFILNVAVGGAGDGSPDSATQFPATMKVDWVRVYPNA